MCDGERGRLPHSFEIVRALRSRARQMPCDGRPEVEAPIFRVLRGEKAGPRDFGGLPFPRSARGSILESEVRAGGTGGGSRGEALADTGFAFFGGGQLPTRALAELSRAPRRWCGWRCPGTCYSTSGTSRMWRRRCGENPPCAS